MKKNIFLCNFFTIFIAAGVLSACGDDKPEVLIAAAKTSLAKNDQKTAIIQIKNALQEDPNLPEARYLLGQALLNSGDPAAAEIELDKSRRLKYSDDLLVPLLVQALLAQGKYKNITDEYSKTELQSSTSKASLQLTLSKAYAAQNMAVLSQTALNSALEYNPENADALIFKIRNLAAKEDFVSALNLVDSVILKNATNPDAQKIKGDILFYGKKDLNAALLAYRKSIEIKSNYVQGYSGILTILFQQNKLEEAQKDLEALKLIAEKSPQTKFFEVQLAYQKKDYVGARALAQLLLKMTPDNALGLQSAGLIEFQLNSLLQAETYLGKAVSINPSLSTARRLLLMTYLRMGQPEKALTVLNTGLAQEPIDTSLYSLAGEIFLQNGDVKKASEYFSKASKLDPKDGKKRTSLALVHMISGDTALAFNELGEIASSDEGISANLALISAHLRRQDFDKALKAIDDMEKKQPNNPLVYNLRGKIQISKNDYLSARKNFEKAVEINPAYFPAIGSLAALDVVEKKPEDAKKRFENVLVKDPRNGQALLGLAELKARIGGNSTEIAELINKAIVANPSEVVPRVVLVDFYLRNKDNKAALTAAQSAATVLPNSYEILDALGRSQLAIGDTNQALASFGKLVSLQPRGVPPLLRLASANMAAKNSAAAEQNLIKALELKSDLLEAQTNLIMLNIASNNYKNAIDITHTIQKQKPKEVVGYILEGDVNVAQKKLDDALLAYREGLKQTSSSEPALKIHAVLNIQNNKVDADKFSTTWMKDHPKDILFMAYLADTALTKKDFIGAEKFYQNIIQLQPENAIAYNNLAWVSGQLKRSGAVAYSEKAIKLSPNQPAFMDTMATLLADNGDFSKSIDFQSKAIGLQPDNSLFKLNMAKIYIKSGDKNKAKNLLMELARLGDKFSAHEEVDSTLKSL